MCSNCKWLRTILTCLLLHERVSVRTPKRQVSKTFCILGITRSFDKGNLKTFEVESLFFLFVFLTIDSYSNNFESFSCLCPVGCLSLAEIIDPHFNLWQSYDTHQYPMRLLNVVHKSPHKALGNFHNAFH